MTYRPMGYPLHSANTGPVPFSSPANTVNQVQYAYDGWGNEISERQALTGVVTSSTPSVQYTYEFPRLPGEGQGEGSQAVAHIRLTDVIYPAAPGSNTGRDIHYDYGPAGAGGVDNIMSRLATISDSNGPIAACTYLGAGTIASEDYQQPQIKLDYSADNFAALDRFGNVLDQVWCSYGSESGGTSAQPLPLDDYTYTYGPSGNRASQENLTDKALSETFQYDKLDRLTSAQRGTVSGGAI